ncbi:DUF3095 family protein [uncultured Gammaproteobacteria bacterium]
MPLPTIQDFTRSCHDPACYSQLPEDWWVAVADIVGSTLLATSGRDHTVNFVAGAVVAALSAVLGADQGMGGATTCQFGGDGATAAVPPHCHQKVAEVLAALAWWAREELDISLRVGMVPIKALTASGLATLAALQDFGNGDGFGQFLGQGMTVAESWVKADLVWRLEPKAGPIPGLEQLSCRWRPVAAQRGVVLCVIADPLAPGIAGIEVLARLLAEIETAVPTGSAGPLGDGSRLLPKLLPSWQSLWLEACTEPSLLRRLRRAVRAVVGSLIIGVVHRLGGRVGPIDTVRYRHALAERSDYRKVSGGPRLVLDVTVDEADRIEAILARAEQAGEILYGTSRADAATMTCLVGNYLADRHVHFVDGAGLGFWRASIELKAKHKAVA